MDNTLGLMNIVVQIDLCNLFVTEKDVNDMADTAFQGMTNLQLIDDHVQLGVYHVSEQLVPMSSVHTTKRGGVRG